MSDTPIIPVHIIALVEDEESGGPIVVLHDQQKNRLLPIWIGDPEARAIALALNNIAMPRPLTHTLLLKTINQMGGKISRVIIDRLRNNTYYASIYVVGTNNKHIQIDARPSDALALGLESQTPIFVSKNIMDTAAQENPFPPLTMELEKRNFSIDDFKKLKVLLEKAREREKKSSENNK